MPVCKCFCRGPLFAEQREWTQWEHIKEMTVRKTMKMESMPDEGSRGDGVDNEDTLKSTISSIRAKYCCDLQSTKAETYEGSENDQWSPAERPRLPVLLPTFVLDVALSRLRIPPARHRPRDHSLFY